jgi:chemotaxis protein CheC
VDVFKNLSSIQIDALREIGNVGAGNAATALSQMVNKKIDMTVPKINILPFDEVSETVGGPENLVVGLYLRVDGHAPSNILFLLPINSAKSLVDMLMCKEAGATDEFGEIEISALKELGNILSGSYLNALAMFTNLTFSPSVPALALDMAGAILSTVLIQLGEVGDHALVIETLFLEENQEVKGHFFLLPDPGSLDLIVQALGVAGL